MLAMILSVCEISDIRKVKLTDSFTLLFPDVVFMGYHL